MHRTITAPSSPWSPTSSLTRDPGRYRWIVLGVATFTQTAAGFFVQGIGALGVQLQRDLGLSTAQLGLLVSAAQLAPLVGLLVAGELLDRFDERWVVSAGAGVVGRRPDDGHALARVRRAARRPPGRRRGLQHGPARRQQVGGVLVRRLRGAGRRWASAQAGLPWAPRSPRGAPAVAGTGWRATLFVGGAVALLGAAAFAVLYRRPPVRPTAARQAGTRLALLRDPAMVLALLCGVGLISVQCGVGLLTVLHLHEAASLPPARAALILVAAQARGGRGPDPPRRVERPRPVQPAGRSSP